MQNTPPLPGPGSLSPSNYGSSGFPRAISASIQAPEQNVVRVYGPIYPLSPHSAGDISRFLKSKPGNFAHPGIWHTHDDLERILNNVIARRQPWASGYAEFSQDSFSQANYTMQGPNTVLSRGRTNNYTSFTNDVRAAWQNALMWFMTKDRSHWDRSTTILDEWGSNLTNIIGTDRSLLIGLEGDLFVNAAEIMRWEGNWTETGASWRGGSGFSNQLYWLFSRQSVVVGQANYGMVSIKALLSFAIYLDDVTLYNYAINEFLNNPCAGLYAMFNPQTGQSVESGRDQSHTMSAIGWTAMAARVAQSQGSDLYELGNNLLLKGSEYTAAYNLNQSVPYDPKWYRCEAVLVNGPWLAISTNNRGVTNKNPMWDIIYYQYVVKRNLHAPWTAKAKQVAGFEGSIAGADHPSWGDFIWSY
ncbi:chondroitin AC/alginate lyase [Zopfia rhizophila CBS 207.26]|uniref:Chondroitin AC/alginate lyase n=1 Tax=Zopfia rhizophila CBS 207.26 TaxID=1314779 RepID=A0A6A6DW25_9PEZI|nr:chondroitin AC/alginate lyase [Zopfia rhizophila CBS 207.26]